MLPFAHCIPRGWPLRTLPLYISATWDILPPLLLRFGSPLRRFPSLPRAPPLLCVPFSPVDARALSSWMMSRTSPLRTLGFCTYSSLERYGRPGITLGRGMDRIQGADFVVTPGVI